MDNIHRRSSSSTIPYSASFLCNFNEKSLEDRVSKVIGNDLFSRSIHILEENDIIKLEGYLFHPMDSKYSQSSQKIFINNRAKRLFTYEYILNKRAKEFQKELSKCDENYVPLIIIIKKIISNEKLSVPRLKIFEQIAPSFLE